MNQNKYKITLSNGYIENYYYVWAFNEEKAIILAQAEAIKLGRGYTLIQCKELS